MNISIAPFIFSLFLFSTVLSQQPSIVLQTGHSDLITDAQISPDEKYLISCGNDQRIIIWDRSNQKQFTSLTGHSRGIIGLAFRESEIDIVYSASKDGTLKKWNYITGECLNTVDFKCEITCFDYNKKKDLFAIGTNETYTLSGDMTDTTKYLTGEIREISFSENGNQLAMTNDENFCGILALNSEGSDYIISADRNPKIYFHKNSVIRCTAMGRLILENFKYNNTKKLRKRLSFPNVIAASSDKIYFGDKKNELHIINFEDLKIIEKKEFTSNINTIDFGKDESLIILSDESNRISIWDSQLENELEQYSGKVEQINCLDFSKNGKEIYLGFSDGKVSSFNLESLVYNNLNTRLDFSNLEDNQDIHCQSISATESNQLEVKLVKSTRSIQVPWLYQKLESYESIWDITYSNHSTFTKGKNTPFIDNYYLDSNLKKTVRYGGDLLVNLSNFEYQKSAIQIQVNQKEITLNNRSFPHHHLGKVTALGVNELFNFFATSSWDGSVKFWDLKSGNLINTLYLLGENQFSLVSPDGYYFTSKTGAKNIGIRYKNKIYPFEQFDLIYNRPDLVFNRFENYISKDLIGNYASAYYKRLEKMGVKESELNINSEIPELSFKIDDYSDQNRADVNVESNSYVKSLHLSVNGVPEFGIEGKTINSDNYKEKIAIELAPGKNVITTHILNSSGMSSLKEEVILFGKKKAGQGDLFLVTIGASIFEQSQYNLDYAAKDAEDVNAFFANNLKGEYNNITNIKLLNEAVTLENIENLRKTLSLAKVNDKVIFFVAGHGVRNIDLDLYYASYNMDFSKPEKKGIPYELFNSILNDCKSRYKCFFMDACHSGEIDKSEYEVVENNTTEIGDVKFRSGSTALQGSNQNAFNFSKSIFTDIRPNHGTTMISSAGGTEFALESDQWNNGVFTYCLLSGLKTNNADYNENKSITLSELKKYILINVSQLTNGLQTPTSRIENLYNDFKIY